MGRTRVAGDDYWILGALLLAVLAASTIAITSCGSGGTSNGGLCEQCGQTDGPCQPSVTVSGSDAQVLCQSGETSCTVQLGCLRKLDSAQRRCFPLDAKFEQFRCDGARADRSTPGPTTTPVPTVTPKSVVFTVTNPGSVTTNTFQITATYPDTKGDFGGTGNVVCRTPTAVSAFTSTDDKAGTLIVTLTGTGSLIFPITITCDFEQAQGQTLVTGDMGSPTVDQAGLAVTVVVS